MLSPKLAKIGPADFWFSNDENRNNFCSTQVPSLTPFIILSLKLECEKLASEKMEIQRHYVMVIEDALP